MRLKIAMILADFSVGGGQLAGVRLANALAKLHDVYLVNARPWIESELTPDHIGSEVKVIETKSDGKHLDRELLIAECRLLGIAVLHSHIWWADTLALQLKEALNIPWVSTLHGCQELLFSQPNLDPDFWSLIRRFYQAIDGIAYLTSKNLVGVRLMKVPAFASVRKIFNGLDSSANPPRPLEKTRPERFRFVLVSRSIPEKGWDTAIEAIAEVNRQRPDIAELTLVGSGPFLEAAQNLAARYGVARIVRFLGHIEKPIEELKTCDVGILPTRFVSESLPNSIAEYMCCGLPVIASDVGEIPNMVAAGGYVAGTILKMYATAAGGMAPQASDLATAMLKYIDDDVTRYLHSKNARRRFDCLFDMAVCTRKYEMLYFAVRQSFSPEYMVSNVRLNSFSADVQCTLEEADSIEMTGIGSGKQSKFINLESRFEISIPQQCNESGSGLVYRNSETGLIHMHPHPAGPVSAFFGPVGLTTKQVEEIVVGIESLNPFGGSMDVALAVCFEASGDSEAISGGRRAQDIVEGVGSFSVTSGTSVERRFPVPASAQAWWMFISVELPDNCRGSYCELAIVTLQEINFGGYTGVTRRSENPSGR
jgi:glycosyltransferase involved in cell wall biosynthesis